jgi:hypothetical protein
MKIFPLNTSVGSRYHSHVWAISKPTSEFLMWLITKMPREWWMDYNKSVQRLLDQRQVDPKIIQICLNDDGVVFLKLKWPVET